MYPFFGGFFLILSTYLVVCLFHILSCFVCLDYIVLGLFKSDHVSHICWGRGNYIPHHFPTRDTYPQSRKRSTRLTPTCSDSSTNMTSESGRSQVLAKWQEAFTRLNGNQPGIAGLMNFTKVPCSPFVPVSSARFLCELWTLKCRFGCICGV